MRFVRSLKGLNAIGMSVCIQIVGYLKSVVFERFRILLFSLIQKSLDVVIINTKYNRENVINLENMHPCFLCECINITSSDCKCHG